MIKINNLVSQKLAIIMKSFFNRQQISQLLSSTEFKEYDFLEVAEGVSTLVYRLVKASRPTYYLRILSQGESVKPQVVVHKQLIDNGLHVPQIIYWRENCKELSGRSCMIVSEIQGRSLEKDQKLLSKAQLTSVLNNAGQELAKINEIRTINYGDLVKVIDRRLTANSLNYAEIAIQDLEDNVQLINQFYPDQIMLVAQAAEMVKENQDYFLQNVKSYLNHGDFDLSHIYQIKGRYTGIIDFGDINGASRFRDLAHYQVFSRLGFDYLLKGYCNYYKLSEQQLQFIKLESLALAIQTWARGIKKQELQSIKSKLIKIGHSYIKDCLGC